MIITPKDKRKLKKLNPELLHHIEYHLCNPAKVNIHVGEYTTLVFVYYDNLIYADIQNLETPFGSMCLYYKDKQIIVRYQFDHEYESKHT